MFPMKTKLKNINIIILFKSAITLNAISFTSELQMKKVSTLFQQSSLKLKKNFEKPRHHYWSFVLLKSLLRTFITSNHEVEQESE